MTFEQVMICDDIKKELELFSSKLNQSYAHDYHRLVNGTMSGIIDIFNEYIDVKNKKNKKNNGRKK